MQITLDRFYADEERTLGLLLVDGKFICYTLEDCYREVKIPKETRILDGTYRLKLRKFGGHHIRYAKRFPDFHVGMIEVLNVEGFTDILIHIGNTVSDTAGCILVGLGQALHEGEINLMRSRDGYSKLYRLVAPLLFLGEDIYLEIVSREGV